MIKIILSMLFKKTNVFAGASTIRGTHSAGRQDRPGVWWNV